VAKIENLDYVPENCGSDSNDDVRRPVWLRPNGVSMKPTIRPGNRVLLMPASINGPKNGAMVCLYHPDVRDYILHRVIKTKNGFCLTCGDNNIYPDPPVAFADIVGEAVAVDFNKGCTYKLNRKWVRRWGGWISAFLRYVTNAKKTGPFWRFRLRLVRKLGLFMLCRLFRLRLILGELLMVK